MTVAVLDRSYDSIQGQANTVGFSGDSDLIRDSLTEALYHLLGGNVLGERLRDAFDVLNEIIETCSQDDWDNYGAKGVTISAYRETKRLIQLFPSTIPMPHISPEPSGGIALEWYKDKNHVFVVTLSGIGVITFAGLYGVDNQLRGTVYFGDSLPSILIENIKLTAGV